MQPLTLCVVLCNIKEIDSMCLFICSATDHRRRENVGKTPVIYSAVTSCSTCSYHILMSSVINYLRTFARKFSNMDFFLRILPLR